MLLIKKEAIGIGLASLTLRIDSKTPQKAKNKGHCIHLGSSVRWNKKDILVCLHFSYIQYYQELAFGSIKLRSPNMHSWKVGKIQECKVTIYILVWIPRQKNTEDVLAQDIQRKNSSCSIQSLMGRCLENWEHKVLCSVSPSKCCLPRNSFSDIPRIILAKYLVTIWLASINT